jgi:hypothetical protein
MVSHELNDAHEGDDRADAGGDENDHIGQCIHSRHRASSQGCWVSLTHIGPGTFTNVLPLAFDRLERRVGRTAG